MFARDCIVSASVSNTRKRLVQDKQGEGPIVANKIEHNFQSIKH